MLARSARTALVVARVKSEVCSVFCNASMPRHINKNRYYSRGVGASEGGAHHAVMDAEVLIQLKDLLATNSIDKFGITLRNYLLLLPTQTTDGNSQEDEEADAPNNSETGNNTITIEEKLGKEITQCYNAWLNQVFASPGATFHINTALALFQQMSAAKLVDSRTLSLFVGYFCQVGDLENIKEHYFAFHIHGLQRDVETYNNILSYFALQSNLGKCKEYMRRMKDDNIEPDLRTHRIWVGAYASVGDVEAIDREAEGIRDCGIRVDRKTYHCLIKAYGTCERGDKAVALLADMEKSGMKPNNDTFDIYFDLMDHASPNSEEALNAAVLYFTVLADYQRAPDMQCLNRLVSKIGSLFGAEAATQLIEMAYHHYHLTPDRVTQHILFDSMFKDDTLSLEEAVLLFHRITAAILGSSETDTAIYCSVIDGYMENCKPTFALEFLRDMKTKGIRPDRQIFHSIIAGLFYNKQPSEALVFLQDMKEISRIEPTTQTFNILIRGQALHNNMKAETLSTIREMSERGLHMDTETQNIITQAYARFDMVDEAMRSFNRMRSTGAHIEYITYKFLINSLIQVGRVKEGLACFEEMKSRNMKAELSLNNTILQSLLQHGLVEEADSCFAEMTSSFGLSPNFVSYQIMVLGSANCNRLDMAQGYFKKWKLAVKSDTPQITAAYETIILACVRARDSKGALSFLERMRIEGLGPTATAYSYIIDQGENAGTGGLLDYTKSTFYDQDMQRHTTQHSTTLRSV